MSLTNAERAARLVAEKTRQIEKLTSEIDHILISEAERNSYPKQPDWETMSLQVRFTPGGKWYKFLLLAVPDGRIFTTGTTEETKVFKNWEALVDWVRSDDIAATGRLQRMTISSANGIQLRQVPFL